MTEGRMRAVAVVPMPEELADGVRRRVPGLDLVVPHELLPPERYPGDHVGDPGFRRTPEQQRELDGLIEGAEVLYGVPGERPSALAEVVARSSRLRWVQLMAAGGGSLVRAAGLPADALQRIAFTTTAGVHAVPLAEFCEFGLLAGFKTLPRLIALKDRRQWPDDRWLMRRLQGSTVLVVGLGHIGRLVAQRLAAQGAHVVGTSRRDVDVEGVARVIRPDAIASVAGEVDGVVITLPGTAQTDGLVGAGFFAALRPGAVVVNVGRGSVVDQDALIAAARDGRVGFAALDVTTPEPLPADSPLWALPNVLVSPHTAASSDDEDRLIADLFADNAARYLAGRELVNRVDTVEFY